jgi:mRNA interferase MazF
MKNGDRIMPDFPQQGYIFWFDPDPVRGSEISKMRPCIVVSPDELNAALRTVIVVPLTTTIIDWPFRYNFKFLGKEASAACDQIRVIDKSRLVSSIGQMKLSDREKLFGLLRDILSE